MAFWVFGIEHVRLRSTAVVTPWMSLLGYLGDIDPFSLVLSAPKG